MAKKILERLGKSSFPPAAVLGAFASFVDPGSRSEAQTRVKPSREAPLIQISFSEPAHTPMPTRLALEYSQDFVLGAAHSAHAFRRSLSGVSVDSGDRIYALADGEVKIFGPGGDLMRSWKAADDAQCLTVSPDGRVHIGCVGQVQIFSATGTRLGGFAVGEANRPAGTTAIKIFQKEILIADAAARHIRRYDANGKQIGVIGTQGKIRGFMLPNHSLDMDVDAKGMIRATDSGRHRVTAWSLDGAFLGYFGKFGQAHLEDFVGCCNPVNLAIAPDGKVATAEKMIARVKVYSPDGKLMALIGPEHFDPKCIHLHLAVDSRGRILAADPVRLQIKVFSALSGTGDLKRA
jgi:hypothetical protein